MKSSISLNLISIPITNKKSLIFMALIQPKIKNHPNLIEVSLLKKKKIKFLKILKKDTPL
jgi:hypothetical protein